MPAEQLSPVSQKAVNYNEDWFRALSAEERANDAARAFLLVTGHLELTNQTVLDAKFEKSCWFRSMIDAFRNYCRISNTKIL